MLSLPDFKEKQLLFVSAEWGAPSRLSFRNENIVFEKDGKIINRLTVHKTFAVFICGDLSLTTNFLKQSKEHGVSIFFLKNNFEMYAGMMTTAEGHTLLRQKQYSLAEINQFEMAKILIQNKIANQMELIKDVDSIVADSSSDLIDSYNKQIANSEAFDELLGIEGNASKKYFKTFFGEIGWYRRAPRTKEDIPNFLMDMGYTFLFNFVDSILRLHGFDTYKGFYHKLFFQRRSLACDIMEPFRCLIDKQIRKSYNLKQINENDFIFKNGSFELPFSSYGKYSKLFLECIMDHKEQIFSYVHEFYRHVMDAEANPFPNYKLK